MQMDTTLPDMLSINPNLLSDDDSRAFELLHCVVLASLHENERETRDMANDPVP